MWIYIRLYDKENLATETSISYMIETTMNRLFALLAVIGLILFTACSPEDRSGEQPFAPTVRTLPAEATDGNVRFAGEVVASPNSSIRDCGFIYGNDTLRVSLEAEVALPVFYATADSLLPGSYYVTAYAANGIGTTYGDTLYFEIP